LHQGDECFLHPRTAGGCKADHRAAVFQRVVGCTHETLADDGAHRAAHEREFKGRHNHRHTQQRTAHGDQRVFFARLLLRADQTILVLFAVTELETVNRLQVCAQLGTAVGIQEDIDAGTRTNAHVVITFRANVQGLFQLWTIKHSVARRAFVPQAFRYRALFDLGTHDRRNQLVYQPVAHAFFLQYRWPEQLSSGPVYALELNSLGVWR